jgi:hypothetical protein
MQRVAFVLVVAALAVLWPARHAVVTPPAPANSPPAPASRAPIIFNEEQENDLGDAIDEHVGRSSTLSTTGDGLSAADRRPAGEHLPPTSCIPVPDRPARANAMCRAAGPCHASSWRSRDGRLASVAHEAGHLIIRQQAALLRNCSRTSST